MIRLIALMMMMIVAVLATTATAAVDEAWIRVADIYGLAPEDNFGWALAVDETTLVVAARGTNTADNVNVGSVTIYNVIEHDDEFSLEEEQIIHPPSPVDDNDSFGWSVAIQGNVLAVGATLVGFEGQIGGADAVYIYIKEEDGSGNYVFSQKLISDSIGSSFGFSVALSSGGTRLAIGAPFQDSSQGTVYVYNLQEEEGDFALSQSLTLADGLGNDFFGISVDMDEDLMIVGSLGRNQLKGQAFIFEQQAGGIWALSDTLEASDANADPTLLPFENARFGISVSISGADAVVGAHIADKQRGKAYLFARGVDGFQETTILTTDDPSEGLNWFGYSVSLGENAVAVGSQRHKDENGAVYLYHRDSIMGNWALATKLEIEVEGGRLGRSTAFSSEGFIAAGAPQLDGIKGAAFVFAKEEPASESSSSEDSDESSSDDESEDEE